LIESVYALLFGLLIGSFLNVCIHRWPRGRSVVKPRSHCVRCRKPIPWYDNIPVVSYMLLRGRCRYCGRHISARYPTVELLTGILFFCFVWKGLTPLAFKRCVLAALLVALLFSDLEKRILPDELTLGGTLIGIAFSIFVPLRDEFAMGLFWRMGFGDLSDRAQSIGAAVLGAVVPAFFLWGGGWLYLKIRHREGLGLGDVKLMIMVGAFLGLQGALATLLIGSLTGSVISLIYIKLAEKDAATYQLPFGTFLGLAGLATTIYSTFWG
jgi:leader peptidase (prepilin peptidase)/N-methyltransferase